MQKVQSPEIKKVSNFSRGGHQLPSWILIKIINDTRRTEAMRTQHPTVDR